MSNTLEKAINPIKRHTIADGYLDVLIDLEKSEGPYIYNRFNEILFTSCLLECICGNI